MVRRHSGLEHRRPRALAWLAAWLLWAGAMAPLSAQDAAHEWNPRTGDAWTDRQLADVNAYAARYPDAFVDELVRYFDLPRALAGELIGERRWAPGDVYYACALAQVAGRPCRAALDAWADGHADGWAAIAGSLGIAPRSESAARVRMAFVDSYARWARPIAPDASLAREIRVRERERRRAAAAAAAQQTQHARKRRKD